MHKQIQFKTIGMNRDLSESTFNPKFAYENKNIRITPTDDNTLLSITNERGNNKISIQGLGTSIEGTPIGQANIDDNWIVFTTGEFDYIYKIFQEEGGLYSNLLYKGDLKFSTDYPIETLVYYENDNIKKVYWTDGLNQPRVINVATEASERSKWNDKSFDFVSSLKLEESVTITKNSSGGMFAPGVIQYAFTYYRKYGQESNIFYTSPLLYTSFENRGGSPEDKVSNSFNIRIVNPDTNFDYIRVYSIHRSSINATPEVKRIVDLPITYESVMRYTDTGTNGEIIDPTILLYIGGEEVVCNTMEQKDNTLFLGNFSLKRRMIDTDIKNYFNKGSITFSPYLGKTLPVPSPNDYYSYESQLKFDSNKIKTFKYLETYRFGIQAQHYTGKWSEPIWINDVRNTSPISDTFYSDSDINLPVAKYYTDNSTIINKLIQQGYVKIRPVVVYPTINDRNVICQGILCPTVYNVGDRFGNAPFAQSSWFTRPNIPFDIENSKGKWYPLSKPLKEEITEYSAAGIIENDNAVVTGTHNGEYGDFQIRTLVNKGAWAEFRHNKPIPGNDKRNAEIQCIVDPNSNPSLGDSYVEDINTYISKFSENYYVDQSIVTMHSPDIEFDPEVRALDTSDLKLRIVGMVPLTAFNSDIDIQTSTPVNLFYKDDDEDSPMGFYKEPIQADNSFTTYNIEDDSYTYGNSHFGYRGLISGAFWFDELSNYKSDIKNKGKLTTGFVVYPWHRNGSLNNTKMAKDGYRSAMLSKKKMSNLRFSYKTIFLSNPWYAYSSASNSKTGISGVSIFDSNEISLVKIPKPENSDLSDISYYGNVDKLLSVSRFGDKQEGYPIMTTGTMDVNRNTDAHALFAKGEYYQVNSDYTKDITGIDPVRIKYKSTPHAVLALNYTKEGYQRILPTIKGGTYDLVHDLNSRNTSYDTPFFWSKVTKRHYQESIDTGITTVLNEKGPLHGWLWLGELYRDNVQNKFGGQTEEAFENNIWLPCGESVDLKNGENPVSELSILWTEGDTYYQRYDHLKTYPFTLEDQNSIVDIVSFMCETRVNLDGRYDRNRGQMSNLVTTPDYFNKINDVYSQPNNFFNYRYINSSRFNIDNFKNSVTWTKTKTAGELVDTWTNITIASTLDLDGDKGPINSLRKINNNLVAFQDTGISHILYNENMQISTTEGLPVEIANSGKVSGKRVITDHIGCQNKWSMCETPNGIYFIDDITKGIYLFNGEVTNLTSNLGFNSWINQVSKINKWDPVNFSNFKTHYDKTTKDVLFTNKDTCLAYSEDLKQFSSFYSYERTPFMTTIKDTTYTIYQEDVDSKYSIWHHHGGSYNNFYNKYSPFYTTVIANPDITKDKIFNTLEFRADSWLGDALVEDTFDTLKVWNEYQEGETSLEMVTGRPSNLKKKFRIWRANIPRDKSNNRNRIRNPWAYIKLSKEKENGCKTVLHDMVVTYFE